MAKTAEIDVDDLLNAPPRRRGRGGILLGLGLMTALGGGGFYAAYSGLVPLPFGSGHGAADAPGAELGAHGASDMPDIAFVPVEELIVSLGPGAKARHLKMSATLEVTPESEADVRKLMPRVLDVLNTYLQALDEADIERPAAMSRMRAHMLRRIQIVVGEGRVRDLLITEFVLQ